MDKPTNDTENMAPIGGEDSSLGNENGAPYKEKGTPDKLSELENLRELENLIKEITDAGSDIEKIRECVDNINTGEQLYNKFLGELEVAANKPKGIKGPEGKTAAENNAIGNYKRELYALKRALEDSPEKFKQAEKAVEKGKSVKEHVANAKKCVIDKWENDGGSHELLVAVHGHDHMDERENHRWTGMKMLSSIPRESIPRTFMDFWGLILIFFIVETFANGLIYAQVQEGLLEGWGIAAAIAFLVIVSGLMCGYFLSFLKGFEERTSNALSGALLKKTQQAAILILIIVTIAVWLYFHKHANDLDLLEKLVPVVIFVAILGTIFWILFFKDTTIVHKDATWQEYCRQNYCPRSLPMRILRLSGAIACLTVGISLIILAYLYREEMSLLKEQGLLYDGDATGNVVGIMQKVQERFSEFNLAPKTDLQPILLLVVNLMGFALSAWKGYFAHGPFQNYKASRESFERKGEEYDENLEAIQRHHDQINKLLNSVINNDYLSRLHQECSELYLNIEAPLLKRFNDAKTAFRDKTGRDADGRDADISDNFKPTRNKL